MEHFEGGCLNCGEQRNLNDAMQNKYDAYLVSGEKKIVFGLCEKCHGSLEKLDKDDLKNKLAESEKTFAVQKGYENAVEIGDKFRSMEVTDVKSFH